MSLSDEPFDGHPRATSYCIACGEQFVDGDASVDQTNGSLHRECARYEEAAEATWRDDMEEWRL